MNAMQFWANKRLIYLKFSKEIYRKETNKESAHNLPIHVYLNISIFQFEIVWNSIIK